MQFILILFFTAISLQLVYFIVIIIALAKKNNIPEQVEPQPVSVIICAHDEEQNLRELIPILLEQDHPKYEVIIVNDRSNDDTYDFLREESLKDPRLRMVNVDHLPTHADGKKYGITLAVKAAKYDIVLFTDADCRPHTKSWISSVSKNFATNTRFVLGYSPYLTKPGFLNLFIRFETLFTAMQYISFALLKFPYMGVGRNLGYRKSLFLEVKGFNDLLGVTGGDDDLFVNRHAKGDSVNISVGSDTLVYSEPKTTWTSFFAQKVRHLSVGKRYKVNHKVVLGVISLSFLASWILGFFLIVMSTELIWVISALMLRTLVLSISVTRASVLFGHKFEAWSVPVLDFLFVFYYISTGTVALFTKKVQWKI